MVESDQLKQLILNGLFIIIIIDLELIYTLFFKRLFLIFIYVYIQMIFFCLSIFMNLICIMKLFTFFLKFYFNLYYVISTFYTWKFFILFHLYSP